MPTDRNGSYLRIMNGVTAYDRKQFQFMAHIVAKLDGSSKSCGGALIAPNVILTAAHCLYSNSTLINPSNYMIGVGSLNNVVVNNNRYIASRTIAHPEYDENSGANDIGLMILSKNVPANIATPTKIYKGKITTKLSSMSAGWGKTSNGKTPNYPSTLKYVDIMISTNINCKISNPLWTGNDGYEICTSVYKGRDTCYGDSGGPLLFKVSGLMPILGVTAGAVAPGFTSNPPCGVKDAITYYSNAAHHLKWIASAAKLSADSLVYKPAPRKPQAGFHPEINPSANNPIDLTTHPAIQSALNSLVSKVPEGTSSNLLSEETKNKPKTPDNESQMAELMQLLMAMQGKGQNIGRF
ncbi:hypothetical protein BB561_001322 [Smittium simulii]|uniref:Peptidase S1 domain-containing protein n=1 Tax=Smittium simulii TaxID=133385 RepID=A0A2T9YV90_9FUNG|nr:hypothetical protein BB561_001322 [Smittium simulii]